MLDLWRERATTGEQNFTVQIKIPIFLEAFLARDNIRAPIQFRRESQPQHLIKDDFSSRIDPSILKAIAPVLLDQSNETSWVFPALISPDHFLPQSSVS